MSKPFVFQTVFYDALVFRILGKPCIVSIYPSDGWITGNTRITVIGVNFFEGLDVVFGTVPVQSEVRHFILSCLSDQFLLY